MIIVEYATAKPSNGNEMIRPSTDLDSLTSIGKPSHFGSFESRSFQPNTSLRSSDFCHPVPSWGVLGSILEEVQRQSVSLFLAEVTWKEETRSQ